MDHCIFSRFLTLTLIFLAQGVQGFNVDTNYPIIFEDLTATGTHFGASLTLLESGWLIIGAPKANSSAENYKDIRQPGVIWRCRVGAGPKECRTVQMDPQGNIDIKKELVPLELVHTDRKDDGMLGASMASAIGSNRFITCASKWANQKYFGHHLMNGICYWVSKENLEAKETNATWPWVSAGLSYRILPLLDLYRQSSESETTGRIHDWRFGQTGFSLHLSENNELIIGAPGILQWSGSVIRLKDLGRRIYGNVLVARAQLPQIAKHITEYSYFGYAVTAGKFFRPTESTEGKIQYAGGAPRAASLCGKVLVFTFNERQGQGQEGGAESLNLLVEPIQGGNAHFSSYFGSALAALDTNGDGFDELLIGAPLFKSSHGNLRSTSNETGSKSGDEGCVFVYISDGENFKLTPQEICGESREGARFGSALSALGDLNKDGYEDVAIGAPYENEGRGAVYIYIGSRVGLVMSQRIEPMRFSENIRGFGYALSPGVDIDNNGYPDLAVGASDSNHVLVFRTIPTVNITGNLSSSVSKLKTGTGEFEIISCLSFNGVNVPDSLQITLKLILDTEVRKQRIAEFHPNSGEDEDLSINSANVIQFTSSYDKSGTCFPFPATTVGDLDLVTLPLASRQEFFLLPQPPTSLLLKPMNFQITKIDKSTKLVQSEPLDAVDEDFDTRWPLQIYPNAIGTNKMLIPIAAICEDDGDPTCLAHLHLTALLRTPDGGIHKDDNSTAPFLIGSYRTISLEVEVFNERETANLPLTVTISWKSPLVFRGSRSDCVRTNADLAGDLQTYSCELRKPLTRNKKEIVELELDMSGIFGDEKSLTFELSANTSSALIEDPSIVFTPPLSTNSELVVFGQLSDAPFYENMTAETINFTHTFEVGMNGMSPISVVQMEFLIPRDIQINGEFVELLRIREPISTFDGNTLRCIGLNGIFYVDPASNANLDDHEDHLSSDDVPRRRKRRSMSNVKAKVNSTRGAAIVVRHKPSVLILNCTMSGIFCLKVSCEAQRFRPTSRAVVEFRLRIMTQTARMLFNQVSDREILIVETQGHVVSLNGEDTQFGNPAVGFSKTLLKVQPPQEIEAWILILSFGGGLILLTAINFLLVQIGFFRRDKKEQLYALRKEQKICETFGLLASAEPNEYEEFPMNYDYEEIYTVPEEEEEEYGEIGVGLSSTNWQFTGGGGNIN